MANLNTYDKRKSSVSILMPFMPPGVVVPGGSAWQNRQAGAWSYAGILAAIYTPIDIIDPTLESLTAIRALELLTIERTLESLTAIRQIFEL